MKKMLIFLVFLLSISFVSAEWVRPLDFNVSYINQTLNITNNITNNITVINNTADGTGGWTNTSTNTKAVTDITGTKNLYINGTGTFNQSVSVFNVSNGGFGLQTLATSLYIQSRGQNLVTNGNGLMGNNYNFATFNFSTDETHGGGGSFLINVRQNARYSDELIPVDISKRYRQVGWGKSGDADGTDYNASNRQYLGLALYDIDGNNIEPKHSAKYAGSTDTELALPLNYGDTTVTLVNATGWYNSTVGTNRHFAWYNYTNSKGYTYPNYTYTRFHTQGQTGVVTANGAWASGGISGNVITLSAPWQGVNLSAGTKVRNNPDGATFKYISAANVIVPNNWTRYEGYIKAPDGTAIEQSDQFRVGTAYVKFLFLINYHNVADNNIRWSDLWFSEMSSENLESATTSIQGVVSTTTQSFSGAKTFTSSITSQNYIYAQLGISLGSTSDTLLSRGSSGKVILSAFGTGHGQFQTNYNNTIYALAEMTGTSAGNYKISTVGGTTGDILLAPLKNVGIGTTMPTQKLDVNGSALFNNFYGSMYSYNDSGYTVSLTLSNTYFNITKMSFGFGNGLSFNSTLNSLNINISGLYKCDYGLSFKGGALDEYDIGLGLNFVDQPQCDSHRTITSTSAIANTGGSCIINASVGQHINILIADNSVSANDITVYASNLACIRVGI